MNNELSQKEDNLFNGLLGYKEMLDGHLEALPKGEGFLDKKGAILGIFANLGDQEWLDNLTRYTLPLYKDLMGSVLSKINDSALENEVKNQNF